MRCEEDEFGPDYELLCCSATRLGVGRNGAERRWERASGEERVESGSGPESQRENDKVRARR